MASKSKPQATGSKRSGYVIGLVVAAGLGLLTAVEYYLGSNPNPSVAGLMLISLIKSVLVVWFFMHVYRLWRTEGSH